jgi:hypothetical protein
MSIRSFLMKQIIVLVFGILVSAGIAGCTPTSRNSKWFEDSFRVREIDTLEDIALSLPIFESHTPREILKSGGYSVTENTDKRWRLLGDGAQPPLLVERVSRHGDTPVIVKVTVGPSLEGVKSRSLMKRYACGWERYDYKEF